jgi:hypothetical protein
VCSRVPQRGTRDKRWVKIKQQTIPSCRRPERSASEARSIKRGDNKSLFILSEIGAHATTQSKDLLYIGNPSTPELSLPASSPAPQTFSEILPFPFGVIL